MMGARQASSHNKTLVIKYPFEKYRSMRSFSRFRKLLAVTAAWQKKKN